MKLLARSVFTCLVMIILATPGVSMDMAPLIFKVSDDGPSLSVTVKDKAVIVLNGDRTVQEFPRRGDALEEGEERSIEVLAALDMNFDGFTDFRVAREPGVPNLYYSCYLWDPETRKFEENGPLGDVSNPVFDKEAGRISAFTHQSVTDNQKEEFRWIDGELTLIWRKSQRYDEDRALFVVTEEILNDRGSMETVYERSFDEVQISRYTDGEPCLDEETISFISKASRELLSSDISGEGELNGTGITDGLQVAAWVFNLENGDLVCFEVPDDRSGLFINMGYENGTFRVESDDKLTMGERVF
ncbi:hypothetical protein L2W58_07895 [Dethiosulfovibrio sp. F2B]|uniref:XAC2610-related protein n=1 Tax=Dethiosulfovibrio faecalis TaxID=2720018 RepID=UPI001F35F77F|nr:hypothetical protein [Dethiosulfovibrio faecalis]MCF4151724.1 hypothetical protein [Dethiosulfovibrio faecalis]